MEIQPGPGPGRNKLETAEPDGSRDALPLLHAHFVVFGGFATHLYYFGDKKHVLEEPKMTQHSLFIKSKFHIGS